MRYKKITLSTGILLNSLGDSGGPKSCYGEDNRWHVVSVASWSSGTCGNNTSVDARVSKYTDDFIYATVKRFEECRFPQFICNDGITCLSPDKICDGRGDCPFNYEDELQNCTACTNLTCNNDGECIDGHCVCPHGWIGDFCETYDCGQGNIIIEEGDVANITSPFYPGNFSRNQNCGWSVTVPNGLKVLARFNDFHLVEAIDLILFEGIIYTGQDPPQNITSVSNTAYIALLAQDTGQIPSERRFLLEISAVNVTGVNECLSNPCENGGTCVDEENGYHCICHNHWSRLNCRRENLCGYLPNNNEITLQKNSSINISSFGYPSYETLTSRYQCKWKIFAPESQRILVEILDAKLDLSYDVLTVGSHLVLSSAEKIDVISETNLLVVAFRPWLWSSWSRFLLRISIYDPPDGNECLSQPCRNGGQCIDVVNGFLCKCRRGFAGKLCNIGM
ncbi:protein tolkin-like [Amphiura filiformis]|uniref:protein tolkin-like n=1 Tax=Amphiura filiformis TaxID=82378 RepID=UPI003B2147C4